MALYSLSNSSSSSRLDCESDSYASTSASISASAAAVSSSTEDRRVGDKPEGWLDSGLFGLGGPGLGVRPGGRGIASGKAPGKASALLVACDATHGLSIVLESNDSGESCRSKTTVGAEAGRAGERSSEQRSVRAGLRLVSARDADRPLVILVAATSDISCISCLSCLSSHSSPTPSSSGIQDLGSRPTRIVQSAGSSCSLPAAWRRPSLWLW
mmetsp:Transcript_37427/g.84798  ORF Transcript_37427/g.84798 Transcript_37427/m.84798 type:complete len:213 (+) Transcript_37427:284-922(+)